MSVYSIAALAQATVFLSATVSIGQVIDEDAQNAISRSADSICGVYQSESYRRTATVETSAQVELQGLARALANIDLGAAGNINVQEATGVLHETLDEEFQSIRECRLAVFEKILGLLRPVSSSTIPESTERRLVTTTTSEYIPRQSLVCSIRNDSQFIVEITKIIVQRLRQSGGNWEETQSIDCASDCLVAVGDTKRKDFRVNSQEFRLRCRFDIRTLQ